MEEFSTGMARLLPLSVWPLPAAACERLESRDTYYLGSLFFRSLLILVGFQGVVRVYIYICTHICLYVWGYKCISHVYVYIDIHRYINT